MAATDVEPFRSFSWGRGGGCQVSDIQRTEFRQYQPSQKRKPEMDTDDIDETPEKKAHQQFHPYSHPGTSTLKRMAELDLDSTSLYKRTRMVHPPRYKSSSVKINLDGKKTYTQQELELIIKRLTDIHQAELDDQYKTFQTFVDDYIFSHSQHPASYIS